MALRLGVGGLQSSGSVKASPCTPLLANRPSVRKSVVFKAICLVIFPIFALSNISNANSIQPVDQPKMTSQNANEQKLKRAFIRITGSMCPACLKRLQEKLKQLQGVADVSITPPPAKITPPRLKDEKHRHHRKALVQVDFDGLQIQPSALLEAIKQNDFGATILTGRKWNFPPGEKEE